MASNRIREMDEIVAFLEQNPTGLSRGQIENNLNLSISYKTLQRRLSVLLENGRISCHGEKSAVRYFPANSHIGTFKGHSRDNKQQVFGSESRKILNFLEIPYFERGRLSYKRSFLEQYVPNETVYVPENWRAELLGEGKRFKEEVAAGTYARQILERMLIDLSYNSSRLEGNTYSVLDTQKLVEEGITAEGKLHEESVMIMNHKEAIVFLVENAREIGLNSFTVFNLHSLLAQDLLEPRRCGYIRMTDVDIGKSAYKPLANPHVLRELFELILLKARAIADPFEQSFFLLIHLSYLQPFADVNKRTSRLACNIPFIKHNLCPLGFTDVDRDDYTAALPAVYEKNQTAPMLDLYCWAYKRSCREYDLAKESVGEIDAFRVMYRQQRKEAMGRVVRDGLHGEEAEALLVDYCRELSIPERDKFVAMTLADLDALHAGAIAGLGITEAQLDQWQENKALPSH